VKRLLLTGGAGLIGHHTIEHILKNTDWEVVVLDRLNYAGNLNFIKDIEIWEQEKDRVSIVHHDFRSPINEITANLIGDVDYIVHMGAESHVDRSIEDPIPFAESNVLGTVNMLEYLRHRMPKARFLYISTDEVFGPAYYEDGKLHMHKEGEPLKPSNPYSASKAGAEAFCYAYWNTYGLDIMVTNTMNNFGERQNKEKFLPRVVRSAVYGEPLKLHCKKDKNGMIVDISSRCWLHARNHADGILFVLQNGKSGEHYNITGEWASVKDIADMVCLFLHKSPSYTFEDFHSFRPGHDMHYGLDGTKLKELGWEPPIKLRPSLEKCVKWMIENPKWL